MRIIERFQISHRSTRSFLLSAMLVVGWVVAGVAPTDAGTRLVWHVETPAGESLDSNGEDPPINPASIVKVATSLWALEKLGPRHRFETRIGMRGTLDARTGTLDGDLIVVGGADPDFHVENAFLVARWLNAHGIKRVEGHLVVCGPFWIGWEGGSARVLQDPQRRAERMALRLRDAIDYRRWGRGTRAEWTRFATRREIPSRERPRVVVIQGVASEPIPPAFEPMLTHRSNKLVNILKRFTAYSNNDIERFGVSLGSPSQLADYLTRRWNGTTSEIRFESLSGLGTNRMSPRQIVRLMRDFREVTTGIGLRVEDLLPVAGCDPGTMSQFPRLNDGTAARVVAGKTGTLTHTDNGITALAGYMHTVSGERVFCVAAPDSSGRIASARRAEEGWLLERIDRYGGPQSLNCGLPPWHSDTDARLHEPAEAARHGYLPGHSAITAGSIPLLP